MNTDPEVVVPYRKITEELTTIIPRGKSSTLRTLREARDKGSRIISVKPTVSSINSITVELVVCSEGEGYDEVCMDFRGGYPLVTGLQGKTKTDILIMTVEDKL